MEETQDKTLKELKKLFDSLNDLKRDTVLLHQNITYLTSGELLKPCEKVVETNLKSAVRALEKHSQTLLSSELRVRSIQRSYKLSKGLEVSAHD